MNSAAHNIAGCKIPRFLFTMHKENALFVPLWRGAVALFPPLYTLALKSIAGFFVHHSRIGYEGIYGIDHESGTVPAMACAYRVAYFTAMAFYLYAWG